MGTAWESSDTAFGSNGRKHRLIDVFSGAGGFTLGFAQIDGEPFEPVWAVDSDHLAAETYNHNIGRHCIVADIDDVIFNSPHIVPNADVVIGGPPCQGFSLLNKGRARDDRKQLWQHFLKVVEISGADVFVMENVPQLLDSPEYREVSAAAGSMGFLLWAGKLCAADYGVPQVRTRAFVVGCRFADPGAAFPPKRTHFDPRSKAKQLGFPDAGRRVNSPEPWNTVRTAFHGLPPEPIGTEVGDQSSPLGLHFGRRPKPLSEARYRSISDEGMDRRNLPQHLTPECWKRKTSGGSDLFGRLWWDRPSVTIRTQFWKPEKGRYLHPEEHRAITHREAARLQSFPDDFHFYGPKIEIGRQIGNAVPPKLARAIAESVVALFHSRRDDGPQPLEREAEEWGPDEIESAPYSSPTSVRS